MFMGYFVSTIVSLRKQLADKLTAESSATCKPQLKALIDEIDTRFSDIVNEPATLAATILHQRFKTCNWIADATVIDRGLRYIKDRLSHIVEDGQDSAVSGIPNSIQTDDDGDFFLSPQRRTVTADSCLEQFLSSNDTRIDSVTAYPVVHELFLELNTPPPSSAAVERLFIVAGLCQTAKRTRMGDDLFESLVFLKVNRCVFKI